MAGSPRFTVVLDDDPTGVQAVLDVPVLLRWSPELLVRAARSGRPSVHLMTNIRSLPPARAEAVTYEAAAAARAALPRARIVLRGDSTLRGHLLEEYRAVRQAAHPDRPPVLLLVPALPAAGRVTIGGIHWLVGDGERRPLHETEYARDGGFSYGSARLLEWAAERTGGELALADGVELPLDELRAGGPAAVSEAITHAAASGRPAVCAPDAETVEDLVTIADGLREAEQAGAEVLVRCAPTFAGVLSGTLATGLVAPSPANGRGVLVVCGSYVSTTTRQLEHLRDVFGIEPIEADVHALAGEQPEREVSRLATQTARQLDDRGVALLSTPRRRPPGLTDLDGGERIARGLADAVAALARPPATIVAKGGITSHVVLARGLGAEEARVAGPIADGVALWRVGAPPTATDYVVFPGNVGGPDHLTHVIRLLSGS